MFLCLSIFGLLSFCLSSLMTLLLNSTPSVLFFDVLTCQRIERLQIKYWISRLAFICTLCMHVLCILNIYVFIEHYLSFIMDLLICYSCKPFFLFHSSTNILIIYRKQLKDPHFLFTTQHTHARARVYTNIQSYISVFIIFVFSNYYYYYYFLNCLSSFTFNYALQSLFKAEYLLN